MRNSGCARASDILKRKNEVLPALNFTEEITMSAQFILDKTQSTDVVTAA